MEADLRRKRQRSPDPGARKLGALQPREGWLTPVSGSQPSGAQVPPQW